MDDRRRIERVCDSLDRHYGVAYAWRERDPLDVLVKVILSQNTTDVNSFRAHANLKRALPSWERVLRAPTPRIARLIRIGGLPNVKARVIKGALRTIRRERGRLSLDFLRSLPTGEARAWLTSLKGVGPKSAAVVLNFALGRPEFPVDTHVYRVAGRLGFYDPERTTREKAYEQMNALTPDGRKTSCHVSLIRLGREVCVPGRPLCPLCPLQRSCDYYQKRMRGWYAAHADERRKVLERGIRKPHTSAIHGRWRKAKGL
jgi:endonuclease-3